MADDRLRGGPVGVHVAPVCAGWTWPLASWFDGAATYPFFSPDGNFIAFFAGGKLRRAPVVNGGLSLAAAPSVGRQLADGRIVYVPGLNAGVARPADGGKPSN